MPNRKPTTAKVKTKKRPMTAQEIDGVVSNVTDQLIVASIADGLRAGAVRRTKKKAPAHRG